MSKTHKITLGTKEWADSNINCYFGCSNNCEYCYAKKMAIRFKRKTEETWRIMILNQKSIDKGYNKRNGRVMFPTSHDITDESLDNCIKVLKKLLKAGNNVLITTKPQMKCIRRICNELRKYQSLIQFRFTITSINNELLRYWESDAPPFEERLNSLKFALENGFKTSISIEPFLDKDPYVLVEKLKPYVTESIWIGKMNYVISKNIAEKEKKYYEFIQKINSKENLLKIVEKSQFYKNNLVRIKDSIFNSLKNNRSSKDI